MQSIFDSDDNVWDEEQSGNLDEGSDLLPEEDVPVRARTTSPDSSLAFPGENQAGADGVFDMFFGRGCSSPSNASQVPLAPANNTVSSPLPFLPLVRSLSPTVLTDSDDDVMLVDSKPGSSNVSTIVLDENPCPGVALLWSGSIWTRYPWHLHHFRIRSKTCTRFPRAPQEPCITCYNLVDSAEIRELRERASQKVAKSMNYRYYTFDQLNELLAQKVEQHNGLARVRL